MRYDCYLVGALTFAAGRRPSTWVRTQIRWLQRRRRRRQRWTGRRRSSDRPRSSLSGKISVWQPVLLLCTYVIIARANAQKKKKKDISLCYKNNIKQYNMSYTRHRITRVIHTSVYTNYRNDSRKKRKRVLTFVLESKITVSIRHSYRKGYHNRVVQ